MAGYEEKAPSSKDLLEAQNHLWSHIFSFINSLSLKCALELGIPDAISDYGKPIPLTQLCKILQIPTKRVENFQRFMRLLVHNGFFKQVSNDPNEDVYVLTKNSIRLIKEKGASITPFVELILDETLMGPWQKLSEWFKSEEPSTAFELFHKTFVWEATGKWPEFGQKLRKGVGSDSGAVIKVVLDDCSELFGGVKSLVEVAGGAGTLSLAIKEAMPEMKCTVLDLPQMINAVEKSDKVEYVAGDMFEYIPPADALIVKWVMHGWNDEACVKLLKQCKKAVPSKEKGGKVIIIDNVMNTSDGVHPKQTETQLHFDIHVMVHTTGKQRTKGEWKKLITEAGFDNYKIIPALGIRSIIEIYHSG